MSGDVIVIDKKLIRSKAFRSLNATAMLVLLDFLMKRKMKGVKVQGGIKVLMTMNNGELQYSYKTALEAGITRPAFARAIDTLISHGFLDIAHLGSGGRDRDASLYSLSDRWMKWDTPEFDAGKQRPKDTRKGRGFSVMWQRKKDEEFEAIFGNAGVTGPGNAGVTPKSGFEGNSDVSSNANVTPKKDKKRRKGASPLH